MQTRIADLRPHPRDPGWAASTLERWSVLVDEKPVVI
jgi:hypothetical protein